MPFLIEYDGAEAPDAEPRYAMVGLPEAPVVFPQQVLRWTTKFDDALRFARTRDARQFAEAMIDSPYRIVPCVA